MFNCAAVTSSKTKKLRDARTLSDPISLSKTI